MMGSSGRPHEECAALMVGSGTWVEMFPPGSKTVHYTTESGSRYSIYTDRDGQEWLVGDAVAHREGPPTTTFEESRGMTNEKAFKVIEHWVAGGRLHIKYLPDDLLEGAEFRYKRTSPIVTTDEEAGLVDIS